MNSETTGTANVAGFSLRAEQAGEGPMDDADREDEVERASDPSPYLAQRETMMGTGADSASQPPRIPEAWGGNFPSLSPENAADNRFGRRVVMVHGGRHEVWPQLSTASIYRRI